MKAKPAIDLAAIPAASAVRFTPGNQRQTVAVLYGNDSNAKPILQLVVTQDGLVDFVRTCHALLSEIEPGHAA
jgi:hypothetical protein